MANNTKETYQNKTSCKGTLIWAYIQKPTLKYKSKTDFEYRFDFLIDPSTPDGKAFLEYLDSKVEEAVEAKKQELIEEKKPAAAKQLRPRLPYKDYFDKEGNETGLMKMSFRADAEFKGKKRSIGLVDAKAKPITAPIQIGNGTTAKVNFSFKFSLSPQKDTAGLKIYPNAVQIIDLVEYSSGNSGFSSNAFGEEDGGFTFDVSQFASMSDSEGADVDSGNDPEEVEF